MVYRFPFGQKLTPVPHTHSGRTNIFVLGAYSSALHARWKFGPRGSDRVKALAIANEPEPFWGGMGEMDLITNHTPPFGSLLSTPQNGASGTALRDRYLIPLDLDAANCWLTDVVNTYFSTPQQRDAFERAYASKGLAAPNWTLPLRPQRIAPDAERKEQLISELRVASPSWLIALGDVPLSALGLGKLSRYRYGQPVAVRIFGIETNLVPFTHPRNAGRLGRHSPEWASIHDRWLDEIAPTLRGKLADA
jgi:hypothetical protein